MKILKMRKIIKSVCDEHNYDFKGFYKSFRKELKKESLNNTHNENKKFKNNDLPKFYKNLLHKNAIVLYNLIKNNLNEDQFVMTNKQISNILNMPTRNIQKSIHTLKAYKIVEVSFINHNFRIIKIK